MTPYKPNVPNDTVFTFYPTLDGNVYTAYRTWNWYRQDWYINLADRSGTHILSKAIAPSPPDYDIDLTYGIFQTSTLIWRDATQQFEVSP